MATERYVYIKKGDRWNEIAMPLMVCKESIDSLVCWNSKLLASHRKGIFSAGENDSRFKMIFNGPAKQILIWEGYPVFAYGKQLMRINPNGTIEQVNYMAPYEINFLFGIKDRIYTVDNETISGKDVCVGFNSTIYHATACNGDIAILTDDSVLLFNPEQKNITEVFDKKTGGLEKIAACCNGIVCYDSSRIFACEEGQVRFIMPAPEGMKITSVLLAEQAG